jgi:hypothetical protein
MCDWYLRLAMDSAVIFFVIGCWHQSRTDDILKQETSRNMLSPWVLNVVPYCTHPNQEKIVFLL